MMRNLLFIFISLLCFTVPARAIGDSSENPAVVKVYPNPSTGLFYFQLPAVTKQVLLEVYNPLGALVQKKVFESQQQLTVDLRNQAKGLYYLKVNGQKAIPVVVI